MKKLVCKIFAIAFSVMFILSLAACSGGGTGTKAAKAEKTEKTAASTDPLEMITEGRYVFSFFAEGYGEYTYYLHFYPEAPVLGAVFYAGFSNNGVNFAGTYEVEQKDYTYSCYADRDAMTTEGAPLQEGTVPYTITFYDFQGNEIESCGYDGDILYNDLTTIAGTGSSPVLYHHDTDPNSQYAEIYKAEAGVTYLEFVDPADDSCTVTLYHNQTYTDLMGIMIEGIWAMAEGTDGGYDYTLTSYDNTDTSAILAVAADVKTAVYTPDGGTATDVVTTAKAKDETSQAAETLIAFTGGYTTLDLLTDGTYKFAFASSGVEEAGTWAFDKTAYQLTLTQENGNVITAAIDGDTHEMKLHYIAVINEQLQDDFTVGSDVWGPALTK